MACLPIALWGNYDGGHSKIYLGTKASFPVALGGETLKSPLNPYSASGNVVVRDNGVHRQWDVRKPHVGPDGAEIKSNPLCYRGGVIGPWTTHLGSSPVVLINCVMCARLFSQTICTSQIIGFAKSLEKDSVEEKPGIDLTVMVGDGVY